MALPTVFMPFCYHMGTKPVVLCRRNEQVPSWLLAWTLKGEGARVYMPGWPALHYHNLTA